MSHRAAAWLAWSQWALTLVLTALSLLLLAQIRSGPNVPLYDFWAESTLGALTFSTVGAFVASRRPENPIGWIFCALGLYAGVGHFAGQYATYAILARPEALPGGTALGWIHTWSYVPAIGLLVFLFLLFPDGRLVSGRWRWIAWFTVAVLTVTTIWEALRPGTLPGLGPIRNPLGIEIATGTLQTALNLLAGVLMAAVGLIAATSMFVRLRRTEGVERQQIMWFAYAAAVFVWSLILYPGEATYTLVSAPWFSWVGRALTLASILSTSVAVGVAVLKYRLYEIDTLIDRTLVYGALTATLVAVYFGGVATTQTVFRALTGQGEQPQLAIVVSTLMIAALFNPLRRRIHSFIERRFYRSKYDARKTLEAFSVKLKDETDLDALSDDLVGVVRETMQPDHVSLWIRPDTTPNLIGDAPELEKRHTWS
jgi:hypothetical protein